MTDLSTAGGLWAERLAGSSAGAAVSLIYLLPENRREAAGRFLSGLACGLVFGGPAGLWLQHVLQLGEALSASELMLSGSAAASLSTWWGLGVLSRLSSRYGKLADGSGRRGPGAAPAAPIPPDPPPGAKPTAAPAGSRTDAGTGTALVPAGDDGEVTHGL